MIRLGKLVAGVTFRTLLTKRWGVVIEESTRPTENVTVRWDDGTEKYVSPMVLVEEE